MQFLGDVNLTNNQIQNAVFSTTAFELLSYFPSSPTLGQMAFVNSTLYICIRDTAPPIWAPLTKEITAYTHTQTSAASVWNITHNLNTTSISATVYNTNNQTFIPDEVTTTGPNTCTISFAAAITGRAVILTGHFEGTQKPTYAFTYYQDSASSTWTVTHNLGYNPIVRVFIGVDEVQPSSISHPSTNQTVITFDSPQVGYVRLI